MTEPRCPYFGRCGGCAHQDIDITQQVEQKKIRLSEAVGSTGIAVFSGEEYRYRNRMDFAFHAEGLGLREKGAFYKFVDIARCEIAEDRLNALLKEVRERFSGVFYFDVRRRFGAFCYAVIRTPSQDSSVSIVLNRKDKKLEAARRRIEEYAHTATANHVAVTYVPHNRNVSVSDEFQMIKGSGWLQEVYLGKPILFPIQGFLQVNHLMAERVHSYCRELLNGYKTSGTHLVDLYAGAGAFGILNADRFGHVTLIENYPAAVAAAEKNISAHQVENVRTRPLDAKHLDRLDLSGPYVLIVDPPRSGIHPKTLRQLNRMRPEFLIYVSCNPKLLQEDLMALDAYRVKSAALFDMFPQTPHMEAVIELVLKQRSPSISG